MSGFALLLLLVPIASLAVSFWMQPLNICTDDDDGIRREKEWFNHCLRKKSYFFGFVAGVLTVLVIDEFGSFPFPDSVHLLIGFAFYVGSVGFSVYQACRSVSRSLLFGAAKDESTHKTGALMNNAERDLSD